MVGKRCGLVKKKATHFPVPMSVSPGALCANAICVGELHSEPTQDGTDRMYVAEMYGSHVCKEHLYVRYTKYILRPLENSNSRIDADWRFSLFDFSPPWPTPNSTFHPCAIMKAAPFWVSAGLCRFFYINVIFQKWILNTIPVQSFQTVHFN